MSIPSTVRVSGLQYTVLLTERSGLASEDPSQTTLGRTFHDELIIRIGTWLHPQMQRLTLLHEVLHAAYSLGVPSMNLAMIDSGEIEEVIVSALESPLMSVLVDNPELLAYLTGGAS